MPERLVFKIDSVMSHALALCYLGGIVVGAYQVNNGLKMVEIGLMNFSLGLILAQMFLMMIGGSFGLFWLGTKRNFLELTIIPSVIGGMLTLAIAHTIVQIYTPVNQAFPYGFGGISTMIALWFIFILTLRMIQLWKIRQQVIASRKFRKKESSTPPPRKEIFKKATEIKNAGLTN